MRDPNNEFEFIPDSGGQPWDPNAPVFPEKQYQEWLINVLPAIEVTATQSS